MKEHQRLLGWLACLVPLCTAPVFGISVTGLVVNQSVSPVENANIDFIDRGTGQNLPLVGDSTNASGSFTVDVPAGNYDITYSPPPASGLAGNHLLNVAVAAPLTLPNVTLPPGFGLALQTVGINGQPVAGVKVNAANALSSPLFLPDNTSNTSGSISTVIPQSGGPFALTLKDVGGSGYADKELLGFAPAGSTNLGPIAVGPARPVSGRTIRYSNLAPVQTVDVDLVDSCGLDLKLTGDLTDPSGNFALSGVSDGLYQIIFRPPGATGLTRREFRQVTISVALALGDVKLGSNHNVYGLVTDTIGTPLNGIDLDFTDQAYNQQVELNNDNTTAAGTFLTQATDGTYTIDFRPPAATPYAPKTIFDVPVTADVNLGTIVLGNAVILSGTVTDPNAVPVVGADLDVIDPTALRKVFTPDDKSGSVGSYSARLAAGTWNLLFTPPASRPDLGPKTYTSQTIGSNATLNVVLPFNVSAAADWQVYE